MTDPESDSTLPGWARPEFLFGLVLLVTASKLVVAAGTGLVLDEAYYTLWSFYPSAGYLDHPPAVAWLIMIGRAIAGEGETGVRLLAVAAGPIIVLAMYRIGQLLFDLRTAALSVIWYSFTVVAALGFLMTPDAPSVLFWTLTLWAVAEFMSSRNANWWLAVGLFAGLGLTAKLTNGFLGIGLFALILSSAQRRAWLKLWQVWAGGALALIVFSPVIAWNAVNGWQTFLFQGTRITGAAAGGAGFLGNLGELIGGQVLAVGPILFVAALAAVILWFRPAGRRHDGLALTLFTSLPLLLYFIYHATHSRVEANWLVPVWPPLTLAAAWAMLRWRPTGSRASLTRALRWFQPALGAVLGAVIFAQALIQPFPSSPLIDRTQEMRGWPELERQVAALAHEHGARWVTLVGRYGYAGALAAYGRFHGTPVPVRKMDDRLRFAFEGAYDPDSLGWPALFVEEIVAPETPPPAPSASFGEAKLVGIAERRHGAEVMGRFAVWLVSAPTPWFYEVGKF